MTGELSGISSMWIGSESWTWRESSRLLHVVALENVLRPTSLGPNWPQDVMLKQAPDPVNGAFRVPSPQAEG